MSARRWRFHQPNRATRRRDLRPGFRSAVRHEVRHASCCVRASLRTGACMATQVAVRRTDVYQRIADDDRGTGGESLSNFLGLFSLGLGLAQMIAPGGMSRLVGIKNDDRNRMTMRLLGAREFSNGVAILSKQQPEKAVWSRVAGDALDLALLGVALANPDNDRGRTLFATANVLAV